jgi:hypothetical protein
MNVEVILANYDFSQVRVLKSIAPLLLAGLIVGAISLAVGIYTFLQMRKMQKKNRPKPNQIDGTIADEGVSFCDIAGSPHIHPNITDLWNKKSEAIKQKSGGFLGIGKSSQVTGYRYYTSFAAFIGNRIEKFIAINFDNRGWIVHDPTKHPVNMLPINAPSLFGQDAGGVVGNIDLEFGYPQPQQNLAYKQHFDLVSAYPYQSYLVFRGNTIDQPFYFGNSNYMKEMLLWVKRTRVRNDGQGQWYEVRGDGAVVCEIGAFEIYNATEFYTETPDLNFNITTIRNDPNNSVTEHPNIYYKNPDQWVIENQNGVSTDLRGDHTTDLHTHLSWEFTAPQKLSGIFELNLKRYSLASNAEFRYIGNAEILFREDRKIENTNSNEDVYLSKFVFKILPGQKIGFTISADGSKPSDTSWRLTAGIVQIYLSKSYAVYNIENKAAGVDINPIHKIREILTDDTAMAKPEIDVNDINFMKAADRIWDDGLGVSWAIDEKPCIDAIEELCYHIEAGIRVNRQTGLYEMVLFRDDWFEENEIHSIAENKIKDLSLEVMNSDDIVNQLNVTYYDRERIKNSTFSVYENGSILTMGKANAESIDFPYFMNMRNAEIVANWKLKQYSTPAWKGTITTGWREARKWNRYDLVKINWSKKWQGTILARIMKIDLGNGLNNEVMIDFEEVVPYSGEMNTSIVVDDSTETKPMPPQSAIFNTFEIPYYDLAQLKTQAELDLELARNPNIGFVAAVAGRPQQNSIDAQLHTESDVGYELVSTVEYASFARTDEAVNRTQQSFVVKNEDLSIQFKQDSLIMLGDEIVIYKSYDAETKTLTVERGALDTIPQNHIENTVLYFYDDAFSYDPEGYTPPKTVNATVLTTTPSGIESLETSPKRQVKIESRAIRPYPPANVKFNDGYYPETIITTNDIVLTWVGRNRLANQVVDFYDSSNDAELNTTYSYELISEDVILDSASGITGNTVTILSSVLIPNKSHTLKLWSVRDGYESYYAFNHAFFAESASLILTATTDGSSVVGNTVPVANIAVNVDESLSANMQFDGSAISGKAEAGAIITIEIQE